MGIDIGFSEERVKLVEDLEIRILKISGKIDMSGVEGLNRGFDEALRTGKKNYLLIMSDVETIKSTGIGAILGFAQKVDKMGGVLKLAELPPNVTQVFDLLSIGNILKFYDSSFDAIESFKGLFKENMDRIRVLKEKNQELEDKFEGKDGDSRSVSDPVSVFIKFLNAVKKRIRQLRAKNRELAGRNEDLKETLTHKESEIDNLRKKLERLKLANQ